MGRRSKFKWAAIGHANLATVLRRGVLVQASKFSFVDSIFKYCAARQVRCMYSQFKGFQSLVCPSTVAMLNVGQRILKGAWVIERRVPGACQVRVVVRVVRIMYVRQV